MEYRTLDQAEYDRKLRMVMVAESNFTLTNSQGESSRIANYARGDRDILLEDAPARITPPNGSAMRGAAPSQAPDARTIERLSPQDRALFDQICSAMQRHNGGRTEHSVATSF